MAIPREVRSYMPKVGEECEVHCAYNQGEPDKNMDWRKTTIFSIVGEIDNEGLVTFKTGWSEQWYAETDVFHLRKFRPIKSERAKFMDKVAEAICDASIQQLDEKSNVRRIAGIIFDAGLAKPI